MTWLVDSTGKFVWSVSDPNHLFWVHGDSNLLRGGYLPPWHAIHSRMSYSILTIKKSVLAYL